MVDLSSANRVHLLGVGGAGMSAIAVVLRSLGCQVSGSDSSDSPVLDRLREFGVDVFVGHRASQVTGADLIARSTAVDEENPEVVAARQAGIPVYRRAEILSAITGLRATVAVAGTHGKTTTAAMLSHVLMAAGADPGYIVGAVLAGGGIGARWSDSPWFVVEADESDGTFGQLKASRGLVTSVEPDHLRADRSVQDWRPNSPGSAPMPSTTWWCAPTTPGPCRQLRAATRSSMASERRPTTAGGRCNAIGARLSAKSSAAGNGWDR